MLLPHCSEALKTQNGDFLKTSLPHGKSPHLLSLNRVRQTRQKPSVLQNFSILGLFLPHIRAPKETTHTLKFCRMQQENLRGLSLYAFSSLAENSLGDKLGLGLVHAHHSPGPNYTTSQTFRGGICGYLIRGKLLYIQKPYVYMCLALQPCSSSQRIETAWEAQLGSQCRCKKVGLLPHLHRRPKPKYGHFCHRSLLAWLSIIFLLSLVPLPSRIAVRTIFHVKCSKWKGVLLKCWFFKYIYISFIIITPPSWRIQIVLQLPGGLKEGVEWLFSLMKHLWG